MPIPRGVLAGIDAGEPLMSLAIHPGGTVAHSPNLRLLRYAGSPVCFWRPSTGHS